MKIKKGFILRKLESEYLVINMDSSSNDFDGFIRLNESGAFLWGLMENGISKEELIDRVCQRYEGVTPEQATADMEEFMEKIHMALTDEK